MNALLIEILGYVDELALVLPVVAAAWAVWRARAGGSAGQRAFARTAVAAVAAGLVVAVGSTIVLAELAAMWGGAPNYELGLRIGLLAGGLTALSALAGATVVRARRPQLAWLGFIVGPFILIGAPLVLGPRLVDLARPGLMVELTQKQDAWLSATQLRVIRVREIAFIDGRLHSATLELGVRADTEIVFSGDWRGDLFFLVGGGTMTNVGNASLFGEPVGPVPDKLVARTETPYVVRFTWAGDGKPLAGTWHVEMHFSDSNPELSVSVPVELQEAR